MQTAKEISLMAKKKTRNPYRLLRSKIRAFKEAKKGSYIYGEYSRPYTVQEVAQ